MHETIEETKRNINLFYQNQQITMTDLYRTKYYSDLIEKNVERLNSYLSEHRKINPQDRQEYARSLNNIAIQTNILKATQKAMADEMNKIKQTNEIQQRISGKLVCLKKDIERLLNKTERLLRNN